MKNDTDRELLHKLSAELERLDRQYDDISPPSLLELEQFIAEESLRRRHRERKELLLFCIVSLVLISVFLAVLGIAPIAFIALQVVFPIMAFVVLAARRIRLQREDIEE